MKVFNNTIKTSVSVILLATILMSMTFLIACGTNNDNNTKATLTKEDIEKSVMEFFVKKMELLIQLFGREVKILVFIKRMYRKRCVK